MSDIPAIPPTTKAEQLIGAINDRIRRINEALGAETSTAAASSTLNYGSHAVRVSRPTSGFEAGSMYFETDRGNVAYQLQGNVWVYAGGVLRAAFAAAPVLKAADAGFLWYVSDYAHVLRWTGTGWEFVDEMGGYVAWRVIAADGSGWQLCDGSATHYLHVTGGVASEVAHTTLNMTGSPTYLKMGAAYGAAINVATLTTSGPTGNQSVGGTGNLAASTSHTHTLTADPIANAVGLPYFRR